jgi:major membrane immunogen (membrane-anchored lipoprotein)
MPSRKATGAVVMSAIVLIGFYTLILNNTNGLNSREELAISTPETTPANNESTLQVVEPGQSPQPSNDQEMPMTEHMGSKYNNGSFTTESDFFTPAGLEGFDVTLELQDDKIVSVNTSFEATHPHSEAINDKLFTPEIGGVVEGKEVDEAELRFVVNGASLHSIAFNQALENIKQEALRTSHNLSYSGN